MKKLFTTVFLLASLLTYTQAAQDENPPMTMTDIKGKTYNVTGTEQGLTIQGLEGKVVFLEFFGHKCPPCLASIPHMIHLQKKYKDKLAIVAIEVQGYNNEQVKAFAKEHKLNYIAVSEEKASELVNYIQQRAQWRGSIPFMVALDTKGDVQFVQAGMIPEESLEELFSQLSK
jgi:thiol-disulfide isomerase/thioredoxin